MADWLLSPIFVPLALKRPNQETILHNGSKDKIPGDRAYNIMTQKYLKFRGSHGSEPPVLLSGCCNITTWTAQQRSSYTCSKYCLKFQKPMQPSAVGFLDIFPMALGARKQPRTLTLSTKFPSLAIYREATSASKNKIILNV